MHLHISGDETFKLHDSDVAWLCHVSIKQDCSLPSWHLLLLSYQIYYDVVMKSIIKFTKVLAPVHMRQGKLTRGIITASFYSNSNVGIFSFAALLFIKNNQQGHTRRFLHVTEMCFV